MGTKTCTCRATDCYHFIRRTRVLDAERTVRAREQEIANPAFYCVTPEQAEQRLAEALAFLAAERAACRDHGTYRAAA